MLTELITSLQNPLIKRFKQVRDGRERHILFIEGARLVAEALQAGLTVESALFSDEFTTSEAGQPIYEQLLEGRGRGAIVPPKLLEAVCDTVSPQGIVVLARQPYYDPVIVLSKARLVLVADRIQDPGNLGTILRSCAAAGVDALLALKGTVDPYGSKALRASMGAAFRLPIVTGVNWPEVPALTAGRAFQLVAAAAAGPTIYTEYDWQRPTLLVLGNEGEGIAPEIFATIKETVRIPIAGQVESLNVAVAASILLFEAARQRGFDYSHAREASQFEH